MLDYVDLVQTTGIAAVAGVLLYDKVMYTPKLIAALEHLSTVLDERLPKRGD